MAAVAQRDRILFVIVPSCLLADKLHLNLFRLCSSQEQIHDERKIHLELAMRRRENRAR